MGGSIVRCGGILLGRRRDSIKRHFSLRYFSQRWGTMVKQKKRRYFRFLSLRKLFRSFVVMSGGWRRQGGRGEF